MKYRGLDAWIDRECGYCRKAFKARRCYVNRGDGKFCSVECAHQARLPDWAEFCSLGGKTPRNPGFHEAIGRKGGMATMSRMTPEQRSALASRAARSKPVLDTSIVLDDVTYVLSDRGYHMAKGGRYLHRDIWSKANGPIPDGMIVHHRDHDSLNNDLANLELMRHGDHTRYHSMVRLIQDAILEAV